MADDDNGQFREELDPEFAALVLAAYRRRSREIVEGAQRRALDLAVLNRMWEIS